MFVILYVLLVIEMNVNENECTQLAAWLSVEVIRKLMCT